VANSEVISKPPLSKGAVPLVAAGLQAGRTPLALRASLRQCGVSFFARVIKNAALLEQAGIFDAQTITRLQTRSEELRADANYRLLGQLHGIEQQDCTRFAQAD
jgi:hypothetical protein